MVTTLVGVLGLVLALLATLAFARARHDRRIAGIARRLLRPAAPGGFDPATLGELPAPARRFFLHTLAPGAPLARSATLEMEGGIALRPGTAKLPFRARQVISADGLVWQAWVGRGLMRFSGDDAFADGAGAMRWFLWGLVPIVRAGGPHVTSSAAGRVGLEVPGMLPAALLPRPGVHWDVVDDRTARVVFRVGDEDVSPAITVGEDGRLERIEMMRWDEQGPNGAPGYVAWAVELSGDRTFGAVTVPTVVRVTKRAGTPEADAFFEARFTRVTFTAVS